MAVFDINGRATKDTRNARYATKPLPSLARFPAKPSLLGADPRATLGTSALSAYGSPLQKQQAYDQAAYQSANEFNLAGMDAVGTTKGLNGSSAFSLADQNIRANPNVAQGLSNTIFGTDYGNAMTTGDQRAFEVANPNAKLGTDGTWTGMAGEPSGSWVDGMSNYQTLQGAAGLGGLAMNAYGMFGSGGTMDVNKKNIELMNQQLTNNREEMANRKGFRADIKSAFGSGA